MPALLAQECPEEMHRELLSSTRFLSTGSRARVAGLVDAVAAGYLTRADDSGSAFASAQMELVESILTELHAACDQHGVTWPADTEAEIRGYLESDRGADPTGL
jgi:hypothetical protein